MMPRRLFLVLLAVLLLPMIAGFWYSPFTQIGQVALFALLMISVFDLSLSAKLKLIEIERQVSEAMSVGVPNVVKLIVRNRNGIPVELCLYDEPPAPGLIEGLPLLVRVKPLREDHVSYHVLPAKRGKNHFGKIFLQLKSRWGFWTILEERETELPVDVYPDIQSVRQIELLARQNRLADAGVRMSRFLGRGNEFERLREYRRGDEYRRIDWKATARRNDLVSREYTVEKNQNLIFLLDCGRGMCNEVNDVSHFDRAMNSMILLSYVALRQGDTVGAIAVSNQLEQWVRPMRGRGSLQKMVRQIYDLQPKYESTDYALMVEQLNKRYRKRSLVILLTYAMDEVHQKEITHQLRKLRSPHLFLSAFLKNVPLMERFETTPTTQMEAFQIAAAGEMLATQSQQIAALQQSGLLVLEAFPHQLSSKLINEYLDIKARHLL